MEFVEPSALRLNRAQQLDDSASPISYSSQLQPNSTSSTWLPSTDLESPLFNPHHFLQRVLSHRFEHNSSAAASSPQQLNREGESEQHFDTDAAAAALDTVESALRRRRDAAIRDEQAARENLRTALNASGKRRDLVLQSSNQISTNVATLSNAAKYACASLKTDLAPLKSTSNRLFQLQDAKDLIILLMHSSNADGQNIINNNVELDAVRVSKLLSKAKTLLDNQRSNGTESDQLHPFLSSTEMEIATVQIRKCQSDLATSVLECLRSTLNKQYGDIHSQQSNNDSSNGRKNSMGNDSDHGIIERDETTNNHNLNRKKKYLKVIAECAAAAEQLGVTRRFIETYVDQIFQRIDESNSHTNTHSNHGLHSYGEPTSGRASSTIDDKDTNRKGFRRNKNENVIQPGSTVSSISPTNILKPFRMACLSSTAIVREHARVIIESFPDPRQSLIQMLKEVLTRKVIIVANSILSSVTSSIDQLEQRLHQLKSSSSEEKLSTLNDPSASNSSGNLNSPKSFKKHILNSKNNNTMTNLKRMTPVERMRNLSVSNSKELRKEYLRQLFIERRRYLNLYSEISVSLSSLRYDAFKICQGYGLQLDFEEFNELLEQSITQDIKGYVDDIEIVDQLKSEVSNSQLLYEQVFHKHFSNYLEIQKVWMDDQLGYAFSDITRIDIHAPRLAPRERSNSEVYHRYRAFYGHVSSSFYQMTQKAIQSANECILRSVALLNTITLVNSQAESNEDKEKKNRSNSNSQPDIVSVQKPLSLSEMRTIIYDILDNLIMNYVANVETLLQAATHLLPVCEEDAKMAQLWISGASPLTAYVQAIEVLSKSNQLIYEFITNIHLNISIDNPHHSAQTIDHAGTEREKNSVRNEGIHYEFDDMHFGISTFRSIISTTIPSKANAESSFDDLENLQRTATEKDILKFIPMELREALQNELTNGLADLSAEAQIGVQSAVSSFKVRLFAMLTTNEALNSYTNESHHRSTTSVNRNSSVVDKRDKKNPSLAHTRNSRTDKLIHPSTRPGFVMASISKLEQKSRDVDVYHFQDSEFDYDEKKIEEEREESNNTSLRSSYSSNTNESENNRLESFDEIRHSDIHHHIEPSAAFISVSTLIEQQLLSIVSIMSSQNRTIVMSEVGKIVKEAVLHCWCNINGEVQLNGALQMMQDGRTIIDMFHDHFEIQKSLECLINIGEVYVQDSEDLWCLIENDVFSDLDSDTILRLVEKRPDFHKSKSVKKVAESLKLS